MMQIILYVVIALFVINLNYVLAWCQWEYAHGRWAGEGVGYKILRRFLWPLTMGFRTRTGDDAPVIDVPRNTYLALMTLGGLELKLTVNALVLTVAIVSIPTKLLLMYVIQAATWPTRYLGLNDFRPGDLAWDKLRRNILR